MPYRINSECGKFRIYKMADERYQLWNRVKPVGVPCGTLDECMDAWRGNEQGNI